MKSEMASDIDGLYYTGNFRLWTGGESDALPAFTGASDDYTVAEDDSHPGGRIHWARVADDGTVLGTVLAETYNDIYDAPNSLPVYWTPGAAAPAVLTPGEIAAELGVADSMLDPYYYYFLVWDADYFVNRGGDVYFPLGVPDGNGPYFYTAALRWNAGDGSVDIVDDDSDGILDLPVIDRPNSSGGNDTVVLEFDYHGDTFNPDYPDYNMRRRVYLNGEEVPALFKNYFDDASQNFTAGNPSESPWQLAYALEANFAQLGDRPVLATPASFLDATTEDSAPTLTADVAGATVEKFWPATPGATESDPGHVEAMNDLGMGIYDNGDVVLNKRRYALADLIDEGSLEANETVVGGPATLPSYSTGERAITTNVNGESRAKKITSIHIDPVTTDTLTTITSYDNIPINLIKNPSVIVIGDSDHPATLTAELGSTERDYPQMDANLRSHLKWQVEASSNATVTFLPPNYDHGTEVKVVGATAGRINFRLVYDNPEMTLPDTPWLRYEAWVGEKLQIKARAQRLGYGSDGNTTQAPDDDTIKNIFNVANVYLRQAGIELIWDDNTSITMDGNLTDFNLSTHDNTAAAIFTAHVKNDGNITPNYSDSTYRVLKGYVQKFLVDNYRPYVLQVGFAGRYYGAPAQDVIGSTFSYGLTGNHADLYGSTLDYIISTSDNGLEEPHTMKMFLSTGYDSAATFGFPKEGGNVTAPGNAVFAADLFGLMIYTQGLNISSSRAVILGLSLAHEVGHVLNLRHRKSAVTEDPQWGRTDELPDQYLGDPLRNLMGNGSSLNASPTNLTGEDIDLLQSNTMRESDIFPKNHKPQPHDP